jgi:hypothetical protein
MLRASRLWRNLKYRKWHGFGHQPNEPGPGGLALFCAACPQPNINLPEGWREDPNQLVLNLIPNSGYLMVYAGGNSPGDMYLMETFQRNS